MTGITNPAEEYFKDGQWGWDGTAWQKLNLLFGVQDRWMENLGGTKSGAGSYIKLSTAVPAGYIYVVQILAAYNATTAPDYISLYLNDSATNYLIAKVLTPGVGIPLYVAGQYVLKAGDMVRVLVAGCLDGDVIGAFVWGYKMKVA